MKGYLILASCIFSFILAAIYLPIIGFKFASPDDGEAKQLINVIASWSLLIIPIFSAIVLGLARFNKLSFVKHSYSVMQFSALMYLVMLFLWFIVEVTMDWRTNIRVDLFIILPTFVLQIIIIGLSRLDLRKSTDDDKV